MRRDLKAGALFLFEGTARKAKTARPGPKETSVRKFTVGKSRAGQFFLPKTIFCVVARLLEYLRPAGAFPPVYCANSLALKHTEILFCLACFFPARYGGP